MLIAHFNKLKRKAKGECIMRTNEINETMSVEKSALICWYYQCKHYTPVRISVITHVDIESVKSVLRRNSHEYYNAERRERAQRVYNFNMSNYYGTVR
jgi:hypothetical protein